MLQTIRKTFASGSLVQIQNEMGLFTRNIPPQEFVENSLKAVYDPDSHRLLGYTGEVMYIADVAPQGVHPIAPSEILPEVKVVKADDSPVAPELEWDPATDGAKALDPEPEPEPLVKTKRSSKGK